MLRSYADLIQDVQQFYMAKPIKVLDLHHHIDRLRCLRLTIDEAAKIYTALRDHVMEYEEINQLLCVMPENQTGLFPIAVGLFHPLQRVRFAVVELLERISTHMVSRFLNNFVGSQQSLIKLEIGRASFLRLTQ